MYTPFKMKGKSPMMKKLIGKQHRLPEHLKAKIAAAPESPTKMKKSPAKSTSKAAKNLLKAVPNKKAYDKLSEMDKRAFDKAAKKAGLPTKSAMKMKKSAMKMMKNPAKPKAKTKTKMLKGTTVFGKEVNKKNVKRALLHAATGGLSETKIGKKAIKTVKKGVKKVVKSLKNVPRGATTTGLGRGAKDIAKKRAVKKGSAAATGGASKLVARKKPITKTVKPVNTKRKTKTPDRAVKKAVKNAVKGTVTGGAMSKTKVSKPTKTYKESKHIKGLSAKYKKDHTAREKLKDQFSTDRQSGRGTLIGNAKARQARNKKRFQTGIY